MNDHPADNIFSLRVIIKEIELRLKKQQHKSSGRKETQAGITLQDLAYRKRVLAKLIAKTIKNGAYRLEPAVRYEALIDGKVRILYRSTIIDTIVMSVAARILNHLVIPILSSRVFSYQKGRSSDDVLNEFKIYLQQYREKTPTVQNRGIYILKRDISAYGESIPIDPGSRLWPLLNEVLNSQVKLDIKHPFVPLLRSMICRELVTVKGEPLGLMARGTPTGSPIQPTINNLYLTDVDFFASGQANGFYARFGDDFIFAHDDYRIAKKVSHGIDDLVNSLGLSMREEKKQNIYMTNPGRPSDDWPSILHSHSVDHLGCVINFKGRIGLKSTKTKKLLWNVRRRIRLTNKILVNLSLHERINVTCSIVNNALDSGHPLSQKSAQLLSYVINDRTQLKHLDYLFALEIAKGVTGVNSVKAFRYISYGDLRNKYGLVSLVCRCNRKKRSLQMSRADHEKNQSLA